MLTINKKTSAKYKPLSQLKEFEQLVGSFIQYWGFKKIHGRIWAHLYTSSAPLDSQTLMLRLKVSKGLMSLAIRDLLEYEVIEAVSTGKHGTTFFQAKPDLMNVITNVLIKREAVMMQAIGTCLERITSENKQTLSHAGLDFEKLQNIKKMTQSAQGLLNLFIFQASTPPDNENINIFSELKFDANL